MTPRDRTNLADLDLDVATRQAISGTYERPKSLSAELDHYRAGMLHLPPHPEWDGDVTDWTADPFGDANWRFQRDSLRWLNPLRWAALEGDSNAQTEWLRVTRSWFDTNVPVATAVPGVWKNMVDGNRAIQLALGAPLVPAGSDWFVELLEVHRDRLIDEANIVHKNHGMHQHAGLLVIGATLRDHKATRTAVDRMRDQFLVTFNEEGSDDEGSVAYHQMNIIWWRTLWERARREGFAKPPEVDERLERACNVLAQIALPNGQLPQIGDTVRGSVAAGLSEATDYLRSQGAKGTRPSGNTLVLERGVIVSRSGWGETRPLRGESHAIIRYGDDIRGHSHQDRGSVHIYADGVRWLVDGGFHSYQMRHPARLHAISRAAHNLASLKRTPHRDSAPVELIGSSVSEMVHDFTLLDHGYRDAAMRRRVIYLAGPDCWLIWDTATPSEPAPLLQQWQVEPGVTVRSLDRGYKLLKSGKSLTMTWLGREPRMRYVKAVEGQHAGWVGVKWKVREAGSLLIAESKESASPQLLTLIAPSGASPLGVVSSKLTTTGKVTAELSRGVKSWRVVADADGVTALEA